MDDNEITIVYFSGTGGVAMIAREMAKNFEAKSRAVRLLSLDRKEREAHAAELAAIPDTSSLLVVLYPVYALDAAQPVLDWLAGAPRAKRLKTAVISVSGGGEMWPNTASRWRVIRRLGKKGYDVFYENMMVMPPNCLMSVPDQLAMHLINAIPRKTAGIIGDLLAGKRRRTGFPLASLPFLWIGYFERRGAKQIGKSMTASPSCTSCGKCARECPQGNIAMRDDRPAFGGECVLCLRCFYGCPVHAIEPKTKSIPLWKEYDLARLQTRMKDVPLLPAERIVKGWASKGILKYLR